jgi:DNA-binding NtrC family response regulator
VTDREVIQNVLLLSHDPACLRAIQEVLARRGVRGSVFGEAGWTAQIENGSWDLAVIDLEISANAYEWIARLRRSDPERPILAIAPPDDASAVIRALREGCRDLLLKPLQPEPFDRWIQTLLPNHKVPLLSSAEKNNACVYQIAGVSRQLAQTIALARKIAPTSVPVLITGESGTGKELISYLIHDSSNRSLGPYVRVNCAALNDSLLESELFGHERGAFTGAFAQRKGRFELADGGTLLLDEISETGPRLQAELLRVLEQQDFNRVGGVQNVCVNVRIISTTNRDLSAEVQAKRFRRDLYYRLAGMTLKVPPLRERPEDIPALVWHFVNLYANEIHRRITELDAQLVDALCRHSWPGNVRQLRNVVRTAMVMGEGPAMTLKDLGSMRDELLPQAAEASETPTLQLQELERQTILTALDRTHRNQVKAARLLGITDRTLREKLRRYRQDGLLQPVGEET